MFCAGRGMWSTYCAMTSSPTPPERPDSATGGAAARPLPFDLFRTWFLLGIQSFGGGTTTLLLIQRTVVEQRGWLTQAEFTRAWAVCQIAPGINLLSVTILIGWRLRRALGVALALTGLLLPSVSVTILLTALYAEVQDLPQIKAALRGIIPATVGLGLLLGARLAQPLLKVGWREGYGSFATGIAILVGSALLVGLLNVSVLWVIWGAGFLGALGHSVRVRMARSTERGE